MKGQWGADALAKKGTWTYFDKSLTAELAKRFIKKNIKYEELTTHKLKGWSEIGQTLQTNKDTPWRMAITEFV